MPDTMNATTDIGRVGIIGAAGWLGGAIAQSLLRSGAIGAEALALSYRHTLPSYAPEAFWTSDNQDLIDRSDIVLVSVRPADWPALAINATGKLVISVMAGVRMAEIMERTGASRVARALPNAAAEVGYSYTPWYASAEVSDEDKAKVQAIFASCGTADEFSTEAHIDYFTGMSGSGPAFPALLASAMVDDAVSRGIERETAVKAAMAVLIGAGRLLEKSAQDPNEVIAAFLDYRGTTAAGIEAMQAAGFTAAIHAGLSAALEKAWARRVRTC